MIANKKLLINIFLLIIVSIGIFYILEQFLQDRGVWGDEAFYTNNILFKNYSDFWLPLDYNVAAPFLFLCAQKAIITISGISDLNFRLLPMTMAFLAIIMNYKLCKHIFNDYFFVGVGLSLFVMSPAIIYFSSEIKPYIIDTLLTISLIYLALLKPEKIYALLILGCLAIFLSNSSVIILFCIAIKMLFDSLRSQKIPTLKSMAALVSWLIAVIVFYIFFVNVHSGAAAWHYDWNFHGGFLFTDHYKFNPLRIIFRITEIFSSPNGFIYDDFYSMIRAYVIDDKITITDIKSFINIIPAGKLFFVALFVAGLVQIFKKRNSRYYFFIILPLIIHFGLNTINVYPVGIRLNLYQFPLIIIIILFGIELLLSKFSTHHIHIRTVVLLALCIIAFNINNRFPYSKNNTKEALNYLLKLKKNDNDLNVTLISYLPMIKHYVSQEKYKNLLKECATHHIRTYPIKAIDNVKSQWFFISPEERDITIKKLKTQWEITEEIEGLNLYKVNIL
ncbi:MAG: hypothetical protein V3V00_05630 [Saprospiraceae bacterium]